VSDDKAYIVTVSHVVEGDPNPTVEFFENNEFKAEVLNSESQANGLALLSVKGLIPYDAMPLYLVKERSIKQGDSVFTFGFPRSGAPWLYDKLSFSAQKMRNLLFSDSDVKEGNSGCPIIKGEQVVAVITSVTDFSYAISAEMVRYFLRGATSGEIILNEMEKWDIATWRKEYEARLEKAKHKNETFRITQSFANPRRIALVIGNAGYSITPFPNGTFDAEDMKDALRYLGFSVIHVVNAGQQAMEVAINTFRRTLSKNAVALFYYSGYGIQYKGKNYLVPIDANISSYPSDLIKDLVEVEYVIAEMTQADTKMNIIILDASNPNPFSNSFHKGIVSHGLSPMNADETSLIAYATSPGKEAVNRTQ
jgi:hypothetical protein